MKSQPLKLIDGSYVPCSPREATHLHICLPGPLGNHILPVMIGGRREGTPNWTWNGDVERPTLRPSILSTAGEGTRTHVWVSNGMVQFLPDTAHDLAGKTLELLDVE